MSQTKTVAGWMAERGVDTTVEFGAGKVLSGLTKRTLPGVTGSALGTPEEIDAYLATTSAS